MKKIFTLIAFVCFSVANALAASETVVEDIDAAVEAGTVLTIKVGDKYLYGSGAQNCAMTNDINTAVAIGNAVVGFKLEKVAEGYLFRAVTPSGGDYALWGKNICYLNGQPSNTGATFILGKDQDGANGSTWTFENGGIKNAANGGYFAGTNTSATPVSATLVVLTPDAEPSVEVLPSLKSFVDNGTVFVLRSGDNYLYGPDNQNVAWSTSYATATAPSNKVNGYILEHQKLGDRYCFRAVNEGANVDIYGVSTCYLNSQPSATGAIFNLRKDQDIKDGSSWTIAEVAGGYTIQNKANGAYLTPSGLSNTPAVFELYVPGQVIISSTAGKNLKDVISGVKYPQTFAVQGENWGNNGTATTGGDVSDSECLIFDVAQGSTQGLALRVWVTNGTTFTTLYAYPEADYAKADFTKEYLIKTPGKYMVKLGSWTKLSGIKAGNNYGANPIVVNWAAACKESDVCLAVDEARTFSSSEILDFSHVNDVEAYIATACDGSKVTMQPVTGKVPANTGLVLKQVSDKAAISIPTYPESTVDTSDNLLVATTTTTEVPKGSYVLAGTGADLGWYSIGSTPAQLAAGKAYLTVPTAAKGQLQMVWGDDNVTAVEVAEEASAKVADNTFYTVAGVKVAQPKKGNLYIYNGKAIVF